MGEEHLAQLGIQHLSVPDKGQRDVSQAEPLQGTRPVLRRFQSHQHGGRGLDRMARFRRQTVAVSGGTGGGIAESAGAQDHGIGGNPLPGQCTDGGNPAGLRFQGTDRGVQPDIHAFGTHQGGQRPGDVAGFLAGGKDPASALYRYRAACALQQGHHILRREIIQGSIKETGIARNLGKEGVPVAVVGQVAAALPGNIDFFPQLFILLQQGDGSSGPGGKQGSGHTRGAAADYDDVRHVGLPPDRRGRISRCPPGAGNGR